MRWNCPHCGTVLALADERIGGGWNFSRCYRCAGFALIRKGDVNLIRVDRAPPGEALLLPEANETPMLSREAQNHLSTAVKNAQQKAEAIPAKVVTPPPPSFAAIVASLPKPLNENQDTPRRRRPLSLPKIPIARIARGSREVVRTAHGVAIWTGQWMNRTNLIFFAIGTAGLLTVGSGFYLVKQGRALLRQSSKTVAVVKPMVQDQVRERAMAPVRDDNASVEQTMGQEAPLRVKLMLPNTNLHSGPGNQYPVIAVGNPTQEYWVTDWRERWYKVIPKDKKDAALAAWVSNHKVRILTEAPQ